jgi:hypothetical protein
MSKRGPGWSWVQAVLASNWATAIKPFQWMHDPLGTFRCLSMYLRYGKFTTDQLKRFVPEVRGNYELYCRKHRITPHPFPPSLEKLIKKTQG